MPLIAGLDYTYNLNGRKAISNELVNFLYYKMEYNVSIHDMTMYSHSDDEYNLKDFMKDVIKKYQESYWHKLPVFIFSRITVKKVNKLLSKRGVPFKIECIDERDDIIENHYALKYIGEFKIRSSENYMLIPTLDTIYTLFNEASKYPFISQKNMVKLIKTINSVQYLKLNHIRTIESINNILNNFEFPFIVSQSIYNQNKVYHVKHIDK